MRFVNRQVRNKVNITNDDVERYYKLNANKFRSEDRVRLRHILLALPQTATPEEVQAVTEKAMDLYKRIVAGADFAELAREYSEGAGQADGGDIGWVNRGTLIGGIEQVAFEKLSVGQVSTAFPNHDGSSHCQVRGAGDGRRFAAGNSGAQNQRRASV